MATKAQMPVDAYLSQLDHPLKDVVLRLRTILLDVDPTIGEEIKWNAPSFRTTEHFATMHLRSPSAIQLILHLGAKKTAPLAPDAIKDTQGLLTWLSPDRASMSFASATEVGQRKGAIAKIVGQWIKHVPG